MVIGISDKPVFPFLHLYNPSVAAITALIVCIRFSASSNTTDWPDSNTSSVHSISVMPNFSAICFQMVVFRSWNAGRQWVKIACGPAFSMTFLFT